MGVIDPDVHEAFDPSQGGIVSFLVFQDIPLGYLT
jgi:hypothetical protein